LDGFPRGLAGYRPVELLGRGASGLVFRAWQQGTGQFVAIKTPHVNGSPLANARFQDDARLRSRLQHPHIAGLVDAGEAAGGQPYVVSEWVPGQTLRRFLLRHGRLAPALASELMAQLLDALACVHAAGIVHRDITPYNLIVSETGARPNVKLIDFGLAARTPLPAGATVPAGGTPGYCAPEQLRGAAPAPEADLYSWGLVFLECLSGRPALGGLGPAELLARQLDSEPVSLPAALKGHTLAPLLHEVLAKNPAHRARSASAVHARLRECMHGMPPEAPADSPAPVRGTAGQPPASSQALTLLCLSVLLTPLAHTALDLSVLEGAQLELQQWCMQAMAQARGAPARTLGDRLLFQFGEPGDDGLLRAALRLLGLRDEAQRRSRLLQIRHGMRLDMQAGLHMQAPTPGQGAPDFNRAASMTLHLNGLATPGTILASAEAWQALRHTLRFQAHPADATAYALLDEAGA
jgi:hypothetical protein